MYDKTTGKLTARSQKQKWMNVSRVHCFCNKHILHFYVIHNVELLYHSYHGHCQSPKKKKQYSFGKKAFANDIS